MPQWPKSLAPLCLMRRRLCLSIKKAQTAKAHEQSESSPLSQWHTCLLGTVARSSHGCAVQLQPWLASMRRILLLLPKLLLHKLMLLRQRLHCKILEMWSSKIAVAPERSFHFLDFLSKFVIGMYKLRIQSLMRFARVVFLQSLVKRACFFL